MNDRNCKTRVLSRRWNSSADVHILHQIEKLLSSIQSAIYRQPMKTRVGSETIENCGDKNRMTLLKKIYMPIRSISWNFVYIYVCMCVCMCVCVYVYYIYKIYIIYICIAWSSFSCESSCMEIGRARLHNRAFTLQMSQFTNDTTMLMYEEHKKKN